MDRWLHHVSGLCDFRVILLCCVTIVHGHFRRFGPFSEDFWWLSEYKCPKVLQTYQNVFWTFPKKFGKFPNLADDLRGGTFWTIILTRRQNIYVKGTNVYQTSVVIPYMKRKISAILRVFIYFKLRKNSSVCDTTVSTINILWSILGEHWVALAILNTKLMELQRRC